MTARRIAVVGMACRYPDADTPEQLWRNVLAGRRAFRRLPDERMRAHDYYSPDPAAPDRCYSTVAAVIEGWTFDRVRYRVAGSTYRSTDLTHWLALDTAARALADANFPQANGLPRQNTGVIIGNTLAGEFSRANVMRLRWPYVRRTVGAALRAHGGWDDDTLTAFLDRLETTYKDPFPPIDEDTLAGGLANTIAGRICNHFDLRGGGFTVDGACSSSLLAVCDACLALADGRLDAAVVGGVDLSIDPFEVIGFAKTGALATSDMRVYDRSSNGFWPGEGCGMLVLMRDEDAVARGLRRYATIAGWGYSSDGRGGITRPEESGHRLALDRAYACAGFGMDTVAYLEGHGTGTAVGDAVELRALTEARRSADPAVPRAAIGTIKANIGHTKAAAGVAGLLKAILAVRHQVIPPGTGHHEPMPALTEGQPTLRVPDVAEAWPAGLPVRAGVSAIGFGGINTHVVVEHADGVRRTGLGVVTRRLVRSRQDRELLLLDADDVAELRGRVARLLPLVARLSYAELADLGVTLHGELAGRRVRAAIVAASPDGAAAGLTTLLSFVDSGVRAVLDVTGDVFLGERDGDPRIGLLFPGQGTGGRGDGGALRRRFDLVGDLYRDRPGSTGGDPVATAVAQPSIVTASLAGLRMLADLGVDATAAVGHSLGELTALHWAGAMDETTVSRIAAARGRIMAEASHGDGTMAGIAAPPQAVVPLLAGEPVVIAAYNGPQQTVVSGPVPSVRRVCERAASRGLVATTIAVSHAFHSELVAPAAAALRDHLARQHFGPLVRRVVSTVTAAELPSDTDVATLLAQQVLAPVRFAEAVTTTAADLDLMLEVGPGRVLTGLAGQIVPSVPTLSLETDGASLSGLLRAVAAAYVLGAPVRVDRLWRGRFTRPLPLDKEFRFFTSPAEAAPVDGPPVAAGSEPVRPVAQTTVSGESGVDVLRRLAARRAELPLAAVRPDSLPLDELHLSSITVGQIVHQASRELGIAPPAVTSAYATANLVELGAMLDQLRDTAHERERPPTAVAGVGPWVRAFSVDLVSAPRGGVAASAVRGRWRMYAPERHPVASALYDGLRSAALGAGVLLCLPHDTDERHVAMMLAAARAVLDMDPPARFVVVGDRRGAAGLARTLHLESPRTDTTVITLPLAEPLRATRIDELVRDVVDDVAATNGYSEVHYDAEGLRRVPVLRPVPLSGDRLPLDDSDVLLVTGGGRGITAECALSLARRSGASVGLLGRADPAEDAELAANLARMTEAGVRHHYVRADVTAPDQVGAAVDEIGQALGPVTAVLHGAGHNEPKAITALDEKSFLDTLAPKITGLDNVLAATDRTALRLLVTFGSIIGRAGLRGEADYATANDWLTELTREVGEDNPDCRCVALEWSVWSGTGMGERLGVVENLIREGVSPISTEQGVDVLHRLLADPRATGTFVVMGRVEGMPTIEMDRPQLPLRRFLDHPRVYYPGVELVVDAELSVGGDLYLADHVLDGDPLFPAALGMEAMVEAAAVLVGEHGAPVLRDVEFLRPVVVPVEGATTIRVAALVTGPQAVQVVVRSAETDFRADHFRATVTFPCAALAGSPMDPAPTTASPLAPADLYGSVLFQGRRFQRLLGYRQLAATRCVAQIANRPGEPWFAPYLPDDPVLGDPGIRDAVMHAIQCCVPDATLLPSGIESLHLADPVVSRKWDTVTLWATERSHDGDTYVYDLDVHDPSGTLVERWQGLRLRAVHRRDGGGPWLPALLGPYLERRTGQLLGRTLRCVVWPDGERAENRRESAAAAARWAVGGAATVRHRPDGRPELDGVARMSAAHGVGLTFVVVGPEGVPVACDVEAAVRRSEEDWAGLLGPDQFALARLVAGELGEDLSLAATRVWTAVECLRKTGRARAESVTMGGHRPDRWVLLRAGATRIATFATTLRDVSTTVVFAMAAEEGD